MPSRTASVAILICWALATFGLVSRDVLPEYLIGSPPDLRTIAQADSERGPTRWSIQAVETKLGPGQKDEIFRAVGTATTESVRNVDDQSIELRSKVSFDSANLLKGTPFSLGENVRIEINNSCTVDASGNPRRLQAVMSEANSSVPILKIKGEFKPREILLKTIGPIPELNRTFSIPYTPRSMVQSSFSPIDRLPGLQVGQRWESRVVSPLTGKVDVVRVEVERQAEIFWDRGLVKTFVVVQKMPPITARTWVRADGLVLRQELPLPLIRLVLERQP